MSAKLATTIRCDGCGQVTHVPKPHPDQARRWATSLRNHVTFVGVHGELQDFCGLCQRSCTFAGVRLVHARDDVMDRRDGANRVLGSDHAPLVPSGGAMASATRMGVQVQVDGWRVGASGVVGCPDHAADVPWIDRKGRQHGEPLPGLCGVMAGQEVEASIRRVSGAAADMVIEAPALEDLWPTRSVDLLLDGVQRVESLTEDVFEDGRRYERFQREGMGS
ncbi:MAG: hypothetical protein ACOH1Y_10110 [Propionicimonas sp.]